MVTGWNHKPGKTLGSAKNTNPVEIKDIKKKTLPLVGKETIDIRGFRKVYKVDKATTESTTVLPSS